MNPALFLLTASVAIVGSNSLSLSPIAGAVAQSFPGAGPSDVMIASAIYGLATAISALTLAPRADWIGADRSLRYAMATLTLALAVSALSQSLWQFCAAQALAGLAAGMALPASYALAPRLAEKGRESETLGVVLAGWTLSMVAGVALSALLADIIHWRGVYAALGLAALLIAALVSIRSDWGARTAAMRTSPITALRVPGIWSALGVVAAFMIAFYGLYAFLGVHVQSRLGYSTALTGLAPLAYGAGFGLAALFDKLIDRQGADRIGVFLFALLSGVYIAFSLAAGAFLMLVALCFVWGLVNHLALNVIVGRLNALDPQQSGAIMGLYSAVTYLAVFGGTFGFRFVFEAYGLAACAAIAALCILPALFDAARLRMNINGGGPLGRAA